MSKCRLMYIYIHTHVCITFNHSCLYIRIVLSLKIYYFRVFEVKNIRKKAKLMMKTDILTPHSRMTNYLYIINKINAN